MSMMTTSASCLSATPRATVAPTLPAPPTTVTLRFIFTPQFGRTRRPQKPQFVFCKNKRKRNRELRVLRVFCVLSLHVLDDVVAEFGSLQLGGAVHQAREIVGHALRADRAFHALDDQVRRLGP